MKSNDIFIRNVEGMTSVLSNSTVGIAGCGGLGSNIAVSLVRAGVGKLIIADFDKVETSNLNRQHFFIDDIGKKKVNAIENYLKMVNPIIDVVPIDNKLTKSNISNYFSDVDIMIEAFDRAEEKAWLLETWIKNYRNKPIICASGLAGFGRTENLKIRKNGNVYICGDEVSDMEEGLCSARVNLVAQMQANLCIELLMELYAKNNLK